METTISLLEASKLATVSQTTIRRWIKAGKLEAKQDKRNNWKIDKQHLLSKLATCPPRHVGYKVETSSQSSDKDRLLSETLEALSRERKINDELRSENNKLNTEIKAILGQQAGSNFKSVLSRWIRV